MVLIPSVREAETKHGVAAMSHVTKGADGKEAQSERLAFLSAGRSRDPGATRLSHHHQKTYGSRYYQGKKDADCSIASWLTIYPSKFTIIDELFNIPDEANN